MRSQRVRDDLTIKEQTNSCCTAFCVGIKPFQTGIQFLIHYSNKAKSNRNYHKSCNYCILCVVPMRSAPHWTFPIAHILSMLTVRILSICPTPIVLLTHLIQKTSSKLFSLNEMSTLHFLLSFFFPLSSYTLHCTCFKNEDSESDA